MASPANSQTFADSACDPEYYQSLEARAFIEAQREITQNQNLIQKPDSVLEYTCFDNHLRELALHALDMFSETARWGNVLPDTHMDDALEALISSALVAYDNANFPASLLGGRVAATGGWTGTPPTEASGSGRYDFESSIAASSPYACDIMQAVWQKAKCMNFAAIAANDGFFTFADYATGGDKRFPTGSCASVTAQFENNYQIALGKQTDGTPAPTQTPWREDDVVTYYDRFFPPSGCGTGATSRIRTGLVVEDKSRDGQPTNYYAEHICIVPGCHWVPSGTSNNPASPHVPGNCVP
ncbi:MAG: hypothetical protein AB8B83_06445 [Bdellovibrionales bacterium]